MTKGIFRFSVVLLTVLGSAQAMASSSAWEAGPGGRVRLVTSGGPDETGIVRGALQIDLRPGWKTYWVDPGDAGVPPTIDVGASTNIVSAGMSFPAPKRFEDGFAKWAGYDRSVSFPVMFKLAETGQQAKIDARIFLGLCETICVPFQAELTVDPERGRDDGEDLAVVSAAFDALPEAAYAGFGAELVASDADRIRVRIAHGGDGAAVEFFLAGSNGYQFGPPERLQEDSRLYFIVPVLEWPDKAPEGGGLAYTLTGADGAVSGTLPFPALP